MDSKARFAFVGLSFIFSLTFSVLADSESLVTSAFVGAEYWGVKTETNEVSRDDDNTAIWHVGLEHKVRYVPDLRFRYSSIDSDFIAFDKVDLTLYSNIFEHDLMHFDVGVTLSQLSDTHYRNENTLSKAFDRMIWAWHGYAEITIPNTNIDVIGEMNFGDSRNIKSTDLMAGMQYRMPFENSVVSIRAGYRAIDFDSNELKSELGKSFVMTRGFFGGIQYSF